MILYDYKRDYEIHIKPCKKLNLGTCINIFVSIILYGIALLLGLGLFFMFIKKFAQYVEFVIQCIISNFQLIIEIIDVVHTYLS